MVEFTLPPELIAQKPIDRRENSNLLIANPEHHLKITKFYNILDYLQAGDVMVFNDTKVIKAKLLLHKTGRKIELYLNKQISIDQWHGFAKPSKKLMEGDQFDFDGNKIIITEKLGMGQLHVKFLLKDISIFEFLEQYGEMPLPPYIKRPIAIEEDNERYQTIYSNKLGAVAAPTAGLHFTDELFAAIRAKNIEITFITLHVGAGTFLPVKTEDIDQHKMHHEYYHISQQTVEIINRAKEENRRIIAVGTTSVRTLESAAVNGRIQAGGFETDIFIKPGYKFQIIDILLTNFHLPKSTLFILVCTFVGYPEALNIYQYAIDQKMRFFSYGDASLLYLKR